MPTKPIKVEFENAAGNILSGRIEMPTDNPKNFALFAHCFACSKDVAAAARISKALAEEGIAVMRFDFTGLGSSGGDFSNTNFTSNVQDLIAAAKYLNEYFKGPSLLVGHSLGGAAILAATQHIDSVKAIVTIGAPSCPSHVKHLFAEHQDEINLEGLAKVQLAGKQFTIKKQFLEDLDRQNSEQRISQLGTPLLIFHSPIDDVVEIEEAAKIYQAAKHPKSFISLDTADHLLTNKEDSEYVALTIAAWAKRYLPS